jgi:hypothetical protein
MQELTTIQNLIKVNKSEFNSYGKYKYRTAEAIMHEIKPYLKEFNLSMYFNDKIESINNLLIIKSIVILKNNETNVKVYGVGYAGIDLATKGMHVAQCCGASTSYARKYALQGLFLLDDANEEIDSKDNTKFNNATNKLLKIEDEIKNMPVFSESNFMKAYQGKATFDEIRKYYILTEKMKQKYILFISEQKEKTKLK